jgi:DNA repair exonuclease SbcCD nuclease subunit
MKFAHIADTHIRNLKYHYEYREVFKQLYDSLLKEKVDCIVHCGDIAHTKTQISPEFVDLCREFFENLCAIAPTYIILGNHDGNLRNESRQDAISPIVKAINNPNLILLRNAGETFINDKFCLNVLSVFDEDNWVQPTNSDIVNIALYHGAIDKSKTDSNWTLGGDHSIEIFDNFDYAFLGDIHKTQKLDKEGRIWYAGSTVQQNFGESLDKGYLLWDIASRDKFTNKLITFNNPKPFITLKLTEKGELPSGDVPAGARVRIVSESNVSLDKVRKAIEVVKYKYDPESVTYLNRAADQKINVLAPVGIKKQDLRDLKTQEQLMSEYLNEFEVTDEVLDKVYGLNKKYNKLIEENEEVYRNVNWSLQSLEWDNLFNYGEDNSIDFTKLDGIVGIFGKNYSGKSSIVDTLLYAMYNSTSKSIRKNLNIINQNKESCRAVAKIKVNDELYTIDRTSSKYIKRLKGVETQEASTDLEFHKEDALESQTVLNGTSRQDTDSNIRKHFGTINDFLMTSMASQLDSLSFINEGSTKRKEYLAKFLDLEIFDKKFKMAKEESAATKLALKKLEGIDFGQQIEDIESEILKSEMSISSQKSHCAILREDLSALNQAHSDLSFKISSVPADVIDPVLTRQAIEEKQREILNATAEKTSSQKNLEEHQDKFSRIEDFLADFEIDKYIEKKKLIDENLKQLDNISRQVLDLSREEILFQDKIDLLSEVPCGNSYPGCKFIKDAHNAKSLIQITEKKLSSANQLKNKIDHDLQLLDRGTVESYLDKYNKLLEKKSQLANSIAVAKLTIERADNSLFKNQVELDSLEGKSREYDDNKDAIENLKVLLQDKKNVEKLILSKDKEISKCEDRILKLHQKHGSLEQKLKYTQASALEKSNLEQDFAAFHLLMTCCHPNGVSYEIIKNRLPFINEEIAKILTNIVKRLL